MKRLLLALLLAACSGAGGSLPATHADPPGTVAYTKPIEIENTWSLPTFRASSPDLPRCWVGNPPHSVPAHGHRRFELAESGCTSAAPVSIIYDASVFYNYACTIIVTPEGGGYRYSLVNESNAVCTIKETDKRVYFVYKID